MRRSVLLVVLVSLSSAPAGGAFAAETARSIAVVPKAGPLAGRAIYGNSHALLIGVNEYPHLQRSNWLQYAANDAAEMRAVLTRSYGFSESNITLLANEGATLANIRRSLARLADARLVGENDRILVYFSGHGQTVSLPTGGDMGFLLPYDAQVDLERVQNPGPYLATCLRMDEIWGYLESSPARHKLIIADACYSGLIAQARSPEPMSPAALTSLAYRPAMQVITAGRKGERSFEMPRLGHGALTFKLLESLRALARAPGEVTTATELFAALQRPVINLTEGKQTPQLGSHNTEGEFLFIPVPAPGETPAPEEDQDTVLLSLDSIPSGAAVFSGGRQIGVTPLNVLFRLGGRGEATGVVTLQLAGYRTEVCRVPLLRGQRGRRVVPLVREAPSGPSPAAGLAPPPAAARPPALDPARFSVSFVAGDLKRAATRYEVYAALAQTFRLTDLDPSSPLNPQGALKPEPFTDVPSDHQWHNHIEAVRQHGLLDGYPDGTFKGDRPVTRYEWAQLLARTGFGLEVRGLRLPTAPLKPEPFADVPPDHWPYNAVEWMRQRGVVEGYPDSTFKGKRPLSLAELQADLRRAVDLFRAAAAPR